MMYWKPPVSRLRDGGFLRLYTLAALAAVLSFAVPSFAGAVKTISVEQNYYDYMNDTGGPGARLTGQGATMSFEDRGFNKAVHVEWGNVDVVGFSLDMFNLGIALEKPTTANTLLGIGAGFVRCDFAGGPMLSFVGDIYGKVKLVKVGNNSLGSFVSLRVVQPTPFGRMQMVKAGLEISIIR